MEIQRHALVKRDYLVPFVLVTSLFFLWGFAHAILDVLNKHFQEVMDITRTHSAMVQVMFYLGYFIMAIPAGLFITKYGYRKGVVFGLLLYGIGSLMFIPGEYWMSFEFFLFSLFVIACGLVFLETAANPYMTELGDRETAASRLNLAQSFNGLGCICGPLVGGLLLFSGKGEANISYPYMLMGVVVLAVGFIFSRIKLPEIVHVDDLADGETVKRSLWSHKLFLFGIVALFSYEIAEISINSFFINYVVDDGWMNARDAAVVLSFGDIVYICEPYEVTSSYKGKMPFFDQYYQMSRERYETESGELTSGYYEDPWVGLYNTLKEGNGKYIFSVNIPLAMQKGESYLAYIDNSKTPNENDGNIYAKNYHIIFNLEKDKPTVFSTEVGDDEFFSSARCYRYQWKILKEKYGDHFKK